MLKSRKWIILLLLFFLIFSQRLLSLEITNGRIKLVLHQGIGRFSLYYLTNFRPETYLPLILDEDPRTSVLSLTILKRIYRLGESPEFKERLEKTKSGARFVWTSKLVEVTEEFFFVSSGQSELADGVKIDLSIKNISNQDLEIGARYLFDTYLGEKKEIHFKTDKNESIIKERTIYKSNMVKYWVSPLDGSSDSKGLQVISMEGGVTTPDTVVFANWKRLQDANWNYETSSSRDFNLLPYSVNDSAVCQVYAPKDVKNGSVLKIVLLMGNANPLGFVTNKIATPKDIGDLLEKATAPRGTRDGGITIFSDLQTIKDLVQEINDKLGSGDVSERELFVIEKIMEELKKKYPEE